VNRLAVGVIAAGALAGAVAVVGSCSDDSHPVVCGDMRVEPPEQCDDGNLDELDACRMCVAYFAPRNVVKWTFNAAAAPGFSSDSCNDLEVSSVRVDLTGPMAASASASCSQGQVGFEALPAGTYTASVTPLDLAGSSLVTAPATGTLDGNQVPSTTTELSVNVGPALWARPPIGNYYFRLKWAGMTCTMAAPPVTTQVVTLSIAGVPVNALTSDVNGLPAYNVNGTQPIGCVASTPATAEHVDGLPFGPARIAVIGRDSGGAEMFRETFDTFIGAGRANPTIELDVDSTIDAGIDAAIDAPTDAPDDAPVDAGVDAPDDAPTDAPPDA
jgi:cysteine-rich repeat protein